MSKKFENFVYLALCAFFLCCTIYTHFCLKGLQLKLFNATLIKHSQASQHDLSSKWIVLANKTLSKSFGVEISYKDFVDWVDKKDWGKGSLTYDYISIDKFKEHDNSNFSWKSNTLHALKLMVLAERSFLQGDYVKCAEITGDLLKREAHAKQLLNGNLPAFVSNEYNVYNTSELMSKATYAMLMTAVDSGVSNYRQAFRGILYYRLYGCYSKLSDYRRSKRSLELSLEELGWEVVQNFMGSNRAVLRALHPRPHWSFVENLGYFISFDFNLLYSIMSVESGFDPTKISSAGACGLMQVMPRTAQSLSRELSESQLKAYGLSLKSIKRKDTFNCRKLKDIQLNIHLATLFLSQLQVKYDRADLIIASYNAGETVVRKWFERSKRKNKAFITEVKFKETYRYISKVLNDWLKYRSVYEGYGFTAQNVRYVN
ncbi:MAG: transglycosylase SLT domain-containing protein [bacterium]|nr:transglycosylase SLT domain-containing protein [bacterium]